MIRDLRLEKRVKPKKGNGQALSWKDRSVQPPMYHPADVMQYKLDTHLESKSQHALTWGGFSLSNHCTTKITPVLTLAFGSQGKLIDADVWSTLKQF